MNLPKQIRVGRKLYTVSQVKSTTPKYLRGRVEFDAKKISITQGYSKEQKAETFWHELTHAILNDMGHPYCFNEKFVTAFGKRLSTAVNSARF